MFVAIYHNISATHLYISDVTGTSYSLSLDYIVNTDATTRGAKFDVHLVIKQSHNTVSPCDITSIRSYSPPDLCL